MTLKRYRSVVQGGKIKSETPFLTKKPRKKQEDKEKAIELRGSRLKRLLKREKERAKQANARRRDHPQKEAKREFAHKEKELDARNNEIDLRKKEQDNKNNYKSLKTW